MKTKNIIKAYLSLFLIPCSLLLSSCDSFLNHDVPQATLSEEQVNDPLYIDNICISAYAIFISAEDINSSPSVRGKSGYIDDQLEYQRHVGASV